MFWIQLIAKESKIPVSRIALGSALSGACKSAVLGTIINSLNVTDDRDAHLKYLLFFAFFVFAYKTIHSIVLEKVAFEVEEIAHRLRTRIIEKLQRAELRDIESISRAEVLNGLNSELPAVTRAVITLFNAVQSATLIAFTFLFIGSLSRTAFMFIFFGSMLAASTQLEIFRRTRTDSKEIYAAETRLNEVVEDALEGFRETKINQQKRRGVFAMMSGMSAALTQRKQRLQRLLSQQLVIAQVTYMLLVGVVVFLAPQVDATFNDAILKTSISMIFLMGPLGTVIGAFQVLVNVNSAAENVMLLEEKIDALGVAAEKRANPEGFWRRNLPTEAVMSSGPLTFEHTLELRGITFLHSTTPDLKPFQIGPIDLTIRRGQIVLLVGGNGSGKSTLLKVLLGLYQPDTGTILLDGVPISAANYQEYREHFGVIFADHHLFTRLYGLETVDLPKLHGLLEYVDLAHKTGYRDNRFDTVALSTGQRKRLGLVEMLMEEKPIMIFDEWAAEQDPGSRKRFYSEILPDLKSKSKTIIAVTHDDAFFHLTDVRIEMDQGLITTLDMRMAG